MIKSDHSFPWTVEEISTRVAEVALCHAISILYRILLLLAGKSMKRKNGKKGEGNRGMDGRRKMERKERGGERESTPQILEMVSAIVPVAYLWDLINLEGNAESHFERRFQRKGSVAHQPPLMSE